MPWVTVRGIPDWVDHLRLLGFEGWKRVDDAWEAKLSAREAADVQQRVGRQYLEGQQLEVEVRPKLKRRVVRQAKHDDAVRRRYVMPSFLRQDVRFDDTGRLFVTPEALALAMGQRYAGKRVVDATCGLGGNAIGFARAGCNVIAIEADPARADLARHNARVYGVDIDIRTGRAEDIVPSLSGDVLFVDPPWSAPNLDPLPACKRLAPGRFDTMVAKVLPAMSTADHPQAVPEAWFGDEEGDWRYILFVTLTWSL